MRKVIILCLCLLCLCPTVRATDTGGYPNARSNGRPYYIMVNRTTNTVTVYGLDNDGWYTVPMRVMICSTGRRGRLTPRGTYTTTSARKTWCLMVDGSYGQYSTQFNGHILFHSVCYSGRGVDKLITEEYNQLGTSVSMGCVRLQVADAKWIYDNCAPGTRVTVYESEDPGPLGYGEPLVPYISEELDNGWEPSDPDERNPWRERFAQAVTLDAHTVSVTAGEQVQLTAAVSPATALYPAVAWSTSDASVAALDETGTVTGLGEGAAEITVSCGSLRDVCTVAVNGTLLPLTDLVPGAAYYRDVRYVYERNYMTGTAGGLFRPNEVLTRAAALQALYRAAQTRPLPEPAAEPDAPEAWYDGVLSWVRERVAALTGGEDAAPEDETPPPWYADALAWAEMYGILDGDGADFLPDEAVSRQELAVYLYRFALLYAPETEDSGSLAESESTELPSDAEEAESLTPLEATRWAAIRGLYENASTASRYAPPTRAEFASILRHLDEITAQRLVETAA